MTPLGDLTGFLNDQKRLDNSLRIIKSILAIQMPIDDREFSLGVEILLFKLAHRGWESAEGDWKLSEGIAGDRDVTPSLESSRDSSLGKDWD